jgi:AraC family transcriptional regulator, regulatory protein of adaptative response / methylated-DNA-[protein]-cysteine methyltransferase
MLNRSPNSGEKTRKAPRTDNAKWAVILARDSSFDDSFVFAVRTTGIYCRPSCPARHAKRANVEFHASAADAERAGFRACKRCKPDQPSLRAEHAAKVAQACRLIEQAEQTPTLGEIAAAAGLSPYHFHRIFKSVAGLTPKAYATAHRNKRVRDKLSRSNSVTEAIYDSGFNSNGPFYASAPDMLGMSPSAYRAGGAKSEIRFAIRKCSLGAILVASTDKGICAIFFGEAASLQRDLQKQFPNARLVPAGRDFQEITDKVIACVEEPRLGLDLPLDVQGTAFQHRVWQELRRIPLGSTASYAEIAKRIGQPSAVRAVARACATNHIAVAIPCHRVVGSDGSLTGYRGGVQRKRALLDREAGAWFAEPRKSSRKG